MSLDITLTVPGAQILVPDRIFVRERGATRPISRKEWDRRHPGREPVTVKAHVTDVAYHGNITHNLGPMAGDAGLYHHLWRDPEPVAPKARSLILPLADGLTNLLEHPDKFRELNPESGWGRYEDLVEFVSEYLIACIRHPEAIVSVSR